MADQDLWRKNLPEDWQGKQAESWDGEIPLKAVVWSTVAIGVIVFVAFVFNLWLMETWRDFHDAQQVESPLTEAHARIEHVSPKLQASPEAELIAMKAEYEEHLRSYGWVDPIEERIHIPVERAMEIVLAEKGTTTRAIEPLPEEPVDVDASSRTVAAGDGSKADAGDAEEH